jgi:DNA-binding transcriptional LysR family regulator
MSDINLTDIRRLDGGLLLVFRELMRRRRAREVAETLGLSQPAISHSLTRLRDLFGDPLFIRRPHGLEPTRRAQELAPRIEALIDMASATLRHEARFDPARTERRFRMAAPEFTTALIGAPMIDRFRELAPNATFGIDFLNENSALDALRRGDVDLALGRFSQIRPGLAAEVLYEDRYCVVARRGHPVVNGSIDLPTFCEVGLVVAMATSEAASDVLFPSPNAVRVTAAVPTWLAALVMVSATDAVASCPRRLAERQAELLDLQVLDPPFRGSAITVSAVRSSLAADEGVDWLLEQVRYSVS